MQLLLHRYQVCRRHLFFLPELGELLLKRCLLCLGLLAKLRQLQKVCLAGFQLLDLLLKSGQLLGEYAVSGIFMEKCGELIEPARDFPEHLSHLLACLKKLLPFGFFLPQCNYPLVELLFFLMPA